MKLKNLFVKSLAVLTLAGGVLGLASCGDDANKDNNDKTEETSKPAANDADKKKVQAALAGITLEAKYNETFALTTTGNGGVTISWASSNTAVIAIDGSNAVVTRPSAEASVKLTATAKSGSYTETKEFTVTVDALEDASTKIADIKALADDTVVEAKGVVTGFLQSDNNGKNGPKGFYLTDSTGTIYVYGDKTAETLELGDEVYLTAKKSTFKDVAQLSFPENANVIAKNQTPDWTAVIKGDIKELNKKPFTELFGNVYEMKVKIYHDEKFGDYKIEAEDFDKDTNNVAWGEYYSGGGKQNNPDYATKLKGHENQVITVRFYVCGTNSKGTAPRGNVLDVIA